MFDREDHRDEETDLEDPETPAKRIRCPECRWQPCAHHRWSCECMHSWNTFDTGGICPACGKQWSQTQCLRCQVWSAHRAWYAAPREDET